MNAIFSKKFHKETDFDFPIGMPPSNPQYWPKEWKEIHHKEYPRLPKVVLPDVLLPLGAMEEIYKKRQTSREYDVSSYLTQEELHTLLFYMAGVKDITQATTGVRRNYPSGGARYPLEVYLAIQRVEGITPGIYHYNVKYDILEQLTIDAEDMEKLKEGLFYPWSRDAAVMFFTTAVWDRNFIKYKNRGYRIILLEAGHMAQNLTLTSAGLGIKCCNSVGFHNRRIGEVLDIEPETEDSLYLALISK